MKNLLLKELNYIIRQINKDGINSELSIYMYNDFYGIYIVDTKNKHYPHTTNNFERAKDWGKIWYRSIVLFLFNLGKQNYEKYRWKKMLKLSGGNFGLNTSVSENKNTLDNFDNMKMNEIQ